MTGIDAVDGVLIFSFCSVCSGMQQNYTTHKTKHFAELSYNKLEVTKTSGFVVMSVAEDGTVTEIAVTFSNRSM